MIFTKVTDGQSVRLFKSCELNSIWELSLTGMTGTCERTCHEVPDGETDYFDEIIDDVMIRIEAMMVRERGRSGSPPVHRGSQQYRQWLRELDRNTLGSRDQFTLVQHLLTYHTALAIKKSCRVKDAIKYLEDFHDKQRQDKFTDIDRKLQRLYVRVCHIHCVTNFALKIKHLF